MQAHFISRSKTAVAAMRDALLRANMAPANYLCHVVVLSLFAPQRQAPQVRPDLEDWVQANAPTCAC